MKKSFLNLPAILYGAGERAEFEKNQAETFGFNPVCFVDADPDKQGLQYLGLSVMSFEQAKEKYTDFLVYITPAGDVRKEIFHFLLDNGIAEDRIFNYTEMEECLGCTELDSKLFVYSNSLISCCKQSKTMKDESMVFWKDYDWDTETTLSAFLDLKENLAHSIKNESNCQCTGCSRIQKDLRPVKQSVKELVLGIEYLCQLSCSYCCYDDEDSVYNVKKREQDFVREFKYEQFIENLEQRGLLSYDTLVSLTGGEITVNPKIDKILDAIEKYRICVYTNGLVYNKRLEKLTSRPGSFMNISVDAGTRETYKHIKGADAFDKVWENIKRYSDNGVKVDLKYILLDENSNSLDLNGFIDEAVKAGVKGSIVVSANYYRQSAITDIQASHIAKMLHMAEQNGLQWYLVQTFTLEEQEKILRLKAELAQRT